MKHAMKYMALAILVVLMVLALYSKQFQQSGGHMRHDDKLEAHPDSAAPASSTSHFTSDRSPFYAPASTSQKTAAAARADAKAAAKEAEKAAKAAAVAAKAAAASKAAAIDAADRALRDAATKYNSAQTAFNAAKTPADKTAALQKVTDTEAVLTQVAMKYAAATGSPFRNYSHFETPSPPELYPTQVGCNSSDIGMATESFSTTIADADHPDIVSTIAVTPELKSQHKAYMARNAGKFLIASQKGLVEDVDQVPQYGLRTYTCFPLQEDPAARQVSGLDLNTTNCRSRQYSDSDYRGN